MARVGTCDNICSKSADGIDCSLVDRLWFERHLDLTVDCTLGWKVRSEGSSYAHEAFRLFGKIAGQLDRPNLNISNNDPWSPSGNSKSSNSTKMSGYVAKGEKDYDATGAPITAKIHKIRITLTSSNVKNLEKCAYISLDAVLSLTING